MKIKIGRKTPDDVFPLFPFFCGPPSGLIRPPIPMSSRHEVELCVLNRYVPECNVFSHDGLSAFALAAVTRDGRRVDEESRKRYPLNRLSISVLGK